MVVNKKKYQLVIKVIETWESEAVIDHDQAGVLRNSLQVTRFDWKRLAKFAFIISAVCLAIAVFSILLDNAILELIRRIIALPDSVKSLLVGLIAGGAFWWGYHRRRIKPKKVFTNEFILFLGALLSGIAIFFFGKAIDTGSGHFSVLIVMSAAVYLLIGISFPSSFMWILGLITLGSWFGTETGYMSGWGTYFLGMNYPFRFVFFGLVLAIIGQLLRRTKFTSTAKPTEVMGLLYCFIALWVMSLFGNYGSMDAWHDASKGELLLWSLFFGAAAIGSFLWGLKIDSGVFRGFGIVFLFINLYTKYFEYFWNSLHKAIFFAVLAVSFWLVGRRAEKIWNIGRSKAIELDETE